MRWRYAPLPQHCDPERLQQVGLDEGSQHLAVDLILPDSSEDARLGLLRDLAAGTAIDVLLQPLLRARVRSRVTPKLCPRSIGRTSLSRGCAPLTATSFTVCTSLPHARCLFSPKAPSALTHSILRSSAAQLCAGKSRGPLAPSAICMLEGLQSAVGACEYVWSRLGAPADDDPAHAPGPSWANASCSDIIKLVQEVRNVFRTRVECMCV